MVILKNINYDTIMTQGCITVISLGPTIKSLEQEVSTFQLLQNVAGSLGAQGNMFVRRRNKIINVSRLCLKDSSMSKVHVLWCICLRTLILGDLGALVSTMFQIIAPTPEEASQGVRYCYILFSWYFMCVQTLPPQFWPECTDYVFNSTHSFTDSFNKKMTEHQGARHHAGYWK